MQPQVGFPAHSVSQLQPLLFSSQYQPLGQMPLPQWLHVPSAHAASVLSTVVLCTGSVFDSSS